MTKSRKKLALLFDRALSNSLRNQVFILVGVLFFTLLLSYLFLSFSGSHWMEFCQEKDLSPWLLPVYLLIDSNTLSYLYMGGHVHGWMLFASSLTFICGTLIFNGILIGVITNTISNRVEDHRNGLTHYLKSGHYIIMGYDEMVPSLITEIFAENSDAYILLLTSFDVIRIKEDLKESVSKKQFNQIIVNYGHRSAKEYYGDIHLESAKEIYIVGNRTDPAHDAINIECIDNICSFLSGNKTSHMPKLITCVFEDLDTYAAFKTSEIFEEVSRLGIDFIPYNFYSGWARQIFTTKTYKEKCNPMKPIPYPSVYGDGICPEDKRFVHLVFVGDTRFSTALAIEAAHMLHFPNHDEHSKHPKTRITFIEQDADKKMPLFIIRNRHFFEIQPYYYRDFTKDCPPDFQEAIVKDQLSDKFQSHGFLDTEFEFIKGDIFSQRVQQEISAWATDKNQYLSLFLALNDQKANFAIGMNLPDEVYENPIPVFIRQDRADNFVTNLRKADNTVFDYSKVEKGSLVSEPRKGRHANLYPFGMNDMAYCSDKITLKQAKIINYLYQTADYSTMRFNDLSVIDTIPAERIWTEADKYWHNLSVALKWSNLYSAYSIPCKLASLRVMRGLKPDDTSLDRQNLTEAEIQSLAKSEHNRWNVEKLLMGFRKAAKEEDKYEHDKFARQLARNKRLFIHHDIRPNDELDIVRQLDGEIVKFIPWILKMTES